MFRTKRAFLRKFTFFKGGLVLSHGKIQNLFLSPFHAKDKTGKFTSFFCVQIWHAAWSENDFTQNGLTWGQKKKRLHILKEGWRAGSQTPLFNQQKHEDNVDFWSWTTQSFSTDAKRDHVEALCRILLYLQLGVELVGRGCRSLVHLEQQHYIFLAGWQKLVWNIQKSPKGKGEKKTENWSVRFFSQMN